MSDRVFHRLRRRLVLQGVTPAGVRPPGSEGRSEDFRLVPARLVEDPILRHYPVGSPTACPAPLAFLDGVQRYEILGYVGATPVLGAVVAAAVRRREAGELRTVCVERRLLLVGRAPAVSALDAGGEECDVLPVELDEPVHPLKDLEAARQAIDAARGELERRVGNEFRRGHDDWLIVDGSLAESAAWARDERMIGVSKSHATLPFDGDQLVSYLRLSVGHRSSVFQPDTRRFAPVYAWGFRLWRWEGNDLLHGLVRVEAAPTKGTLARVDELSRWILAERAPLSRPDPRWDRLLYGVHLVERSLRSGW